MIARGVPIHREGFFPTHVFIARCMYRCTRMWREYTSRFPSISFCRNSYVTCSPSSAREGCSCLNAHTAIGKQKKACMHIIRDSQLLNRTWKEEAAWYNYRKPFSGTPSSAELAASETYQEIRRRPSIEQREGKTGHQSKIGCMLSARSKNARDGPGSYATDDKEGESKFMYK